MISRLGKATRLSSPNVLLRGPVVSRLQTIDLRARHGVATAACSSESYRYHYIPAAPDEQELIPTVRFRHLRQLC
jgi:hypothetical protein